MEKKKRSLEWLCFASEIRINSEIKVCQADLTFPPRAGSYLIRIKTNRWRYLDFFELRAFFFSFIHFTKSRLCSSVSLAANKPKELAQGSNREPARSGVMSAREVACVRACIPPSLGPAHLAHIWDKSPRLAGNRPPCNLPPPPPPPTTSPGSLNTAHKEQIPFLLASKKKPAPSRTPPDLPTPPPPLQPPVIFPNYPDGSMN